MRLTKETTGGVVRAPRWRRVAAALAAVAAVLLALFLLRAPILTQVAAFLTVEDPLVEADAIVLLNGGLETRPAGAAALHARGLAPIVVLARAQETSASALGLVPNHTDVTLGLLGHYGVPDSAIRQLRTPGGSTSTSDEARIFQSYASSHDFSRVIIVTSDYHTRRTRRAFRQAVAALDIELVMVPVPSAEFSASDWWQTEVGLLAILEEYVKLIRDIVRD